jgi:hypothetical protein
MPKYSNLLYRCPGSNRGPGGHTYEWKSSSSESETDGLLKDGWFQSLDEAVEAAKVEGEAVGPVPDDSPMTTEERSAAAKKALTVAAERALAANRALAADAQAAVVADRELAEVVRRAEAAEIEKERAMEEARSAAAERARAAGKAQAANKALSSSKMHVEAAKRVLDDAAARVLASDQLLSEATAKALAAAEAAEQALAAAERKGTLGAHAPVDPSADAAKKVTFKDVKAALMRLKSEVDAKAVTKLLKHFGVAAAPELSEDKYAEVLAAAEKELY